MIDAFFHSSVPSSIHLCIHPFHSIHPSIYSFISLFVFLCLSMYPLIPFHSIHSFIPFYLFILHVFILFIHSFIHSLIHPSIYPFQFLYMLLCYFCPTMGCCFSRLSGCSSEWWPLIIYRLIFEVCRQRRVNTDTVVSLVAHSSVYLWLVTVWYQFVSDWSWSCLLTTQHCCLLFWVWR